MNPFQCGIVISHNYGHLFLWWDYETSYFLLQQYILQPLLKTNLTWV